MFAAALGFQPRVTLEAPKTGKVIELTKAKEKNEMRADRLIQPKTAAIDITSGPTHNCCQPLWRPPRLRRNKSEQRVVHPVNTGVFARPGLSKRIAISPGCDVWETG